MRVTNITLCAVFICVGRYDRKDIALGPRLSLHVMTRKGESGISASENTLSLIVTASVDRFFTVYKDRRSCKPDPTDPSVDRSQYIMPFT